jgi:single-strand DNA-binding protein
MNEIYLMGRIVHSPEVKTTKSGTKVCTFTLAVRREYKDQSGEYQTDFFDVQAWRTLADLCEKYLEKGRTVIVRGSMQSRTYEKDGVKRKVWELMADKVKFLSDGKSAANPDQQQGKAVPKSNTNGFDPANQYTQADDEELPF